MHRINLMVLCTCMLVLPSALMAGGFQINDNSARAVGMGFAAAYGGYDASTVFYNPAGMTQLADGFHLSGGLAYIAPDAKFTGITDFNQYETSQLESKQFPIPNLYAVWHNREMNLALGLGVFVPFGLGTEWPGDWVGRNLAVLTTLEVIAVNPNIAYSMLDNKLSLSAGLVYATSSVELKQKILSFDPEPEVALEGSDNTIGFNVALAFKPMEELSLGVSYRHNLEFEYEGDASFSNVEGLEALFQGGPGGTSITMPFDLRIGAAWQLSPDFLLSLGLDLVGWSSYDTLVIHFDKAPGDPTSSLDLVNPRNYTDAIIASVAGEYTLSERWIVRGGVYYDQVPVEAMYTQPLLPDADRFGFSIGAGHNLGGGLTLDVAYLGIYGLQREVENSPVGFNGIYNAWAHVGAVGLNYSW